MTRRKGKLSCLGLVLLATLGIAPGVQSQNASPEAGENQDSQAIDERRTRVLYIEAPVAINSTTDPILDELAVLDLDEDPAVQARLESIRQYNSDVADIETNGGVWDQALVEELSALGELQQEQGDHEAAVDTLSRALHINRINAGLHTLEQVAVVENMIDSYMVLGEWEQVDLYQNYLYYVQRKAYGAQDPRIIPALDRLGRWHLEAFSIGYGEPLGVRLLSAQMLFRAAKRMVSVHFGRNDERYVTYLRNVARSAFLVSEHPQAISELTQVEYRTSQDRLRDLLLERVSVTTRYYDAGHEALQEIVTYHEEEGDSPYLLAEAIADLADWELMFGQRNAASGLYERAWQILAEQDESEKLLERLFGQVIPIPAYTQLPTNLLLGSRTSQNRTELAYDYADVRLNVNRFGAPRDVEVLTEATETNGNQFSQLRRAIRGTHFRPRIVNGVPQESEGHLFRYRYWY